MNSWLVRGAHVLPLKDLRDHFDCEECWCKSTYEDGVIVHHSLDRRESYERGEEKPS